MPKARVQLTGQVLYVGPGMEGPIARSRGRKFLARAGAFVLIPVLAAAVLAVRFTFALTRTLTGGSRVSTGRGHFRRHVSNVIGALAARHLHSVGRTVVTPVRIRDSAGRIVQVRIEGQFVSGALAPADSVTFQLHAVDGVYVVAGGINHTTREPIRLSK